MATQMNELAGLESNLGDQMDSIYNKIGKKLEPAIKSFMGTLGKIMGTISGYLDSTNEKFEDQIGKVISLQTKLGPLLSRYDELKIKTNLSAAEQSELNSLIKEIARIVPSAVSEWNDYGEAISVNTEKAKEFIETEKKRLAYINRGQIEETQSNIESYKKTVDIYTKLLKEGGKWKTDRKTGDMFFVQFSNEELQDFKKKLDEAQQLLEGSYEQMKVLTGQTIEEQINSRIERNKKMEEAQSKFNKMNKSMLAAWIADEKNATNEYLSLAKEIYKNRFPDIPVDPKEIEKAAREAKQAAEKEKKAILDTEKDVFESMRSMREEELIAQEKWYNDQKFALNISLQEKNISQEQYSIMMLALDKANSTARLNIEKAYYEDSQSLLVTNIKLKEDFIRESNKRIVEAEKKNNEDLINEQQKINDIVREFKQDFNLITPKDAYQMEIDALNASYNARKDLLISNGKDLLELEESFEKAKLEMAVNYEKARQQALDKYGLVSLKEKYKLELNEFAIAITEWELSTEEIIAGFLKIKTDYINKLVNTWTDIFSNAFQSLQDAEINNIETKYNKEIDAAKGNADEVERLENEKEQKKLNVQKKYADINFAIKVSQIIADTAVSVMKAYADLGPIAGAIAAAVVSATGAIQIAAANAERNKVKSMTVSGSSIGVSSGTYTRVPGKQSGGYIDVTRAQDGKEFKAVYDPKRRGFIDKPTVIVGEGPAGSSKEWVASNEAVKNPTIAPILSILDQAQQAGTIRTLDLNKYLQAQAIGRQSGGGIQSATVPSPTVQPDLGLSRSIKELNDTLLLLKKDGLPAYTLLDDFDKARKLQERSRKIGSKR